MYRTGMKSKSIHFMYAHRHTDTNKQIMVEFGLAGAPHPNSHMTLIVPQCQTAGLLDSGSCHISCSSGLDLLNSDPFHSSLSS